MVTLWYENKKKNKNKNTFIKIIIIMALEAKNINTIDDMQNYVEGCLNDMEYGIITKKETLEYLKQYTFRIIELSQNL